MEMTLNEALTYAKQDLNRYRHAQKLIEAIEAARKAQADQPAWIAGQAERAKAVIVAQERVEAFTAQVTAAHAAHEEAIGQLQRDYSTARSGIDQELERHQTAARAEQARVDAGLAQARQTADQERARLTEEIQALEQTAVKLRTAVAQLRERVAKVIAE